MAGLINIFHSNPFINKYLGILFNFEMFGVLNWLAIPCLIFFLVTIRKRQRYETALVFVLLLLIIFLCSFGYKNYRYLLTLHPVLIIMVILFIAQVYERFNYKFISFFFILWCCLIAVNFYYFHDSYFYYLQKGVGITEAGEGFPYKLIDCLKKDIDQDATVLQYNQPIIYYYTNLRSMSFNDQMEKDIYRDGRYQNAINNLRNKYGVSYILSRGELETSLYDIIQHGCEVICEDQGYKLYVLRNEPVKVSIDKLKKIKPAYASDFSKIIGSKEYDFNNIGSVAPLLTNLGNRGNFVISSGIYENIITCRLVFKGISLNVKPEIQMGYYIGTDALDLGIKEGDAVTCVIVVRTHNGRNGELFIQDKTDYWDRSVSSFDGGDWQEVMVRKKIRKGFEQICLGIHWFPETEGDWLELQTLKIYIDRPETDIR